jgi:serine/threonine protein kinase
MYVYILHSLGSGSFGVVIKGTYNGNHVAIKKIKGLFTEKEMSEFLKEGELTRNIPHHPNVIRCFGVCLTPLSIGRLLLLTPNTW